MLLSSLRWGNAGLVNLATAAVPSALHATTLSVGGSCCPSWDGACRSAGAMTVTNPSAPFRQSVNCYVGCSLRPQFSAPSLTGWPFSSLLLPSS